MFPFFPSPFKQNPVLSSATYEKMPLKRVEAWKVMNRG